MRRRTFGELAGRHPLVTFVWLAGLLAAATCLVYFPVSLAHRAWTLSLARATLGVQAVWAVALFSGVAYLHHAERTEVPLPPPALPSRAPRPPPGEVTAPESCAACGKPAPGEGRCPACGAVRTVGPYRVLRLLQQNDHARTYLVSRPDARPVVLKELMFALVPDAAAIAAFEREAALLRQIHHPAVPRYVDSFVDGQGPALRFYLAHEFVEGTSLAAELAERRFSEGEVLDLLRQMLEILVYLHGQSPRILHRDIKPANIIRRPDGGLSLIDFGSARHQTETLNAATLVGTFGYMPPEQLAGQVNPSSDLYALGATAVHLLSRREPWQLLGDAASIQLPAHLEISQGVRSYLERLVASQPHRRFQSAREALAGLEQAQRGGAGSTLRKLTAVGVFGCVLLGALTLYTHRVVAPRMRQPQFSARGLKLRFDVKKVEVQPSASDAQEVREAMLAAQDRLRACFEPMTQSFAVDHEQVARYKLTWRISPDGTFGKPQSTYEPGFTYLSVGDCFESVWPTIQLEASPLPTRATAEFDLGFQMFDQG